MGRVGRWERGKDVYPIAIAMRNQTLITKKGPISRMTSIIIRTCRRNKLSKLLSKVPFHFECNRAPTDERVDVRCH